MRLSGTIPAVHRALSVLSLSRNYLDGTTDTLTGTNGLQTLILSSNYLSCDAVDLSAWLNLYAGTWNDAKQQGVHGRVAQRVLVHVPIMLVCVQWWSLHWMLIVFVFVDLEFGVGVVVCCTVADVALVLVGATLVRRGERKDRAVPWEGAQDAMEPLLEMKMLDDSDF